MFREMKILGFATDSRTTTPIVVLRDVETETSLPIWIGLLEATAIATGLEEIQFTRPMTHDLIKNLITQLGVTVDRVELHDLRYNVLYAWICLNVNGEEVSIDARPSDALAIALRMNAPIYLHERVLAALQCNETGQSEIHEKESNKWTEILQNLSPEDFGKYMI